MRADLRFIHSPDVDDLTSYIPDSVEQVELFLQLMIGPVGVNGYESFDVIVCTVGALREKCRTEGMVAGDNYLFIESWDFPALERMIRSRVNSIESDDWVGLARQLSSLGRWELSP